MHPHIQEQLAKQHREELLRAAATTRPFIDDERPSSFAKNRALLSYLLFGRPFSAGKQPGRNLFLEQAHSAGILRMVGLVALALGLLAGSLLDSRFGLAPAAFVDGAVVLAVTGLVVSRSIRLVRTRHVRHF